MPFIFMNPKSKTDCWYSENDAGRGLTGEFFKIDPPVNTAYPSNRILFVGKEDDFDKFRQNFEKEGNRAYELYFVLSASSFWKSFFNKENFLDGLEGRTIPKQIITTGYIKNFNTGLGDVYMDINERLKEIADAWEIKLVTL